METTTNSNNKLFRVFLLQSLSQMNAQPEDKNEMFNATGAKLLALEAIINRREKYHRDKILVRNKMEYAMAKVNALLKAKTKENQLNRLYDSDMSNLNKMAIFGDEHQLRQELKNKFPVNTRDSITGRTLLHEASCLGHLHIVRMLCRDFKANPCVPTILVSFFL